MWDVIYCIHYKKTYVRNLRYIIKKSATFAMPESNCGVVLFLSVIHT